MASIYKRKAASRVRTKERTLLPKSASGDGGTFISNRIGWVDQRISRLIDENRRLMDLAECLRADIMRMAAWRDTQH